MAADLYNLTEPQRDRLLELMTPLREGRSFTQLAREVLGEEGEDEVKAVKNLASYLSEAFRGKARGLTYVFGSEARLTALEAVLGQAAGMLSRLLAQVVEELPVHDRLVFSGIEELGLLPLDELFVLPPIQAGSGPMDPIQLERHCFEEGVFVIAAEAGRGLTTVLRQVASWGLGRGYSIEPWTPTLPNKQGCLLLGDRVPGSALPEIEEWCKGGARRAVIGLPPGYPLIEGVDAVLGSVNDAWLKEWCEQLLQRPAPQRRWLPKNPGPLIQRVLDCGGRLGPEEATILLRWLAGTRAAASPPYFQALQEALLRRGLELAALPTLEELREMQDGDPASVLAVRLAGDVEADLAQVGLSATSRRILHAALPALDTGAWIAALTEAGVLRQSRTGLELRLLALQGPSLNAADAVLVALESGTAEEVMSAVLELETLNAMDWDWTPKAFERCVAARLLVQMEKRPRLGVRPSKGWPRILGSCRGASPEGVFESLTNLAEALDQSVSPRLTLDGVAFALAACNAAPSVLLDRRVWQEAVRLECIPKVWLSSQGEIGPLAELLLQTVGSQIVGSHELQALLLHNGAIEPLTEFVLRLGRSLPDVFAGWVQGLLSFVCSSLEAGEMGALKMLRPVDGALGEDNRIAGPLRKMRGVLGPLAERLLGVLPLTAWKDERDPSLRHLLRVLLSVDVRARLSSGVPFDGPSRFHCAVHLAGLDLVPKEQSLALLQHIEGKDLNGLDDFGVSRILDHALRHLPLEDLQQNSPSALRRIERVRVDLAPLVWWQWPAVRESCWRTPGPYDEGHPIWRLFFETRLSIPWLKAAPSSSLGLIAQAEQDRAYWALGIADQLYSAHLNQPRNRHFPESELRQILACTLALETQSERWCRIVAGIASFARSPAWILESLELASLPVAGLELNQVLASIVRAAQREEPGIAGSWLVRLLGQRPDIADSREMRAAWEAFGNGSPELDSYLDTGGNTPRGQGVFGALTKPVDVATWLENSDTETAAWERLIELSPETLSETAGGREQLPIPIEILRELRKNGQLSRLIEASTSWEEDHRRALWKRIATLYSGSARARLLAE